MSWCHDVVGGANGAIHFTVASCVIIIYLSQYIRMGSHVIIKVCLFSDVPLPLLSTSMPVQDLIVRQINIKQLQIYVQKSDSSHCT